MPRIQQKDRIGKPLTVDAAAPSEPAKAEKPKRKKRSKKASAAEEETG